MEHHQRNNRGAKQRQGKPSTQIWLFVVLPHIQSDTISKIENVNLNLISIKQLRFMKISKGPNL